MLSEPDFRRLAAGLSRGDEEAVRECVAYFEPQIRRAARVRLRDPRVRRFIDTVDVTQSVFRRFLTRCRHDPFTFERPEQVLALLLTMAHHRVTDWARRNQLEQKALSHHGDRYRGLDRVSRSDDPARVAQDRELFRIADDRLSTLEREILHRRNHGQSWEEIGEALQATAGALRKRLSRALARVRKELSTTEH